MTALKMKKMQNDFVNLVDSLYGSETPVILPGMPMPQQQTIVPQKNETIKYVVLGIIFLAFVYLVLKALKTEPPVATIVQQQPEPVKVVVPEKMEEPIPKTWTTPWTPEPEEFTVVGPLPYSESEEERQFSKISADGNDTNLETYMKKREDFSKK